MSKKKYLTKSEKEMIAYLYRKKLSIGKIAYVLGRHRRTIFNYKNYKLPGKTKDVHTMYTQKETPDDSKEQATFQMFYDECKKGNRYHDPESISLFLVHGKKGDEKYRYLRKFKKLPRYEGGSNQEIINDVANIVFKNHLKGNPNIDLTV